MLQIFDRFLTDDSGSTAIEYGLIAAILAVAIVASLTNVRTGLIAVTTDVIAGLRG